MMVVHRIAVTLLAGMAFGPGALVTHGGENPAKPRLLVLTDIGGDPDDQQSLVRLLHYANAFDIEGLIASASGTPGELKEAVTRPELIREIVRAYGLVRDNLNRHQPGYPTESFLLERIKAGNRRRGWEAVGAGHDTEGSEWIIQVVDGSDVRPVDISIWGGQTDLAQALWRVRQDRGPDGLVGFLRKIRVHDIADQDDILDRMRASFPGLFYILNKAPAGADRREAAFRGLYLGGDESLVSRHWMETHIRQGHGPLGALYPPRTWTAPNPHSAIKEGDTPSWFYFLRNGLNDPSHPDWGGWGGRFELGAGGLHLGVPDTVGGETHVRATVWRWRAAFQADFQARLDWGVAERFEDANHAPEAVLNGDTTRNVLQRTVGPGDRITLRAEGSQDPDGDTLSQRWFLYPEAGSWRGPVALEPATGWTTVLVAPEVREATTLHVILEVKDDGDPSLTSHRRAVITVRP